MRIGGAPRFSRAESFGKWGAHLVECRKIEERALSVSFLSVILPV